MCPSDEWLSLTSSLNGQDVQDGDTLLLRKKFFILNDDIHEAVKGNDDLRELIYQQVTMVTIIIAIVITYLFCADSYSLFDRQVCRRLP